MMASLTERNLENARKGLFERDEDWCNTVIADDEEVDTLEVQIDREGVNHHAALSPTRLRHAQRHIDDEAKRESRADRRSSGGNCPAKLAD